MGEFDDFEHEWLNKSVDSMISRMPFVVEISPSSSKTGVALRHTRSAPERGRPPTWTVLVCLFGFFLPALSGSTYLSGVYPAPTEEQRRTVAAHENMNEIEKILAHLSDSSGGSVSSTPVETAAAKAGVVPPARASEHFLDRDPVGDGPSVATDGEQKPPQSAGRSTGNPQGEQKPPTGNPQEDLLSEEADAEDAARQAHMELLQALIDAGLADTKDLVQHVLGGKSSADQDAVGPLGAAPRGVGALLEGMVAPAEGGVDGGVDHGVVFPTTNASDAGAERSAAATVPSGGPDGVSSSDSGLYSSSLKTSPIDTAADSGSAAGDRSERDLHRILLLLAVVLVGFIILLVLVSISYLCYKATFVPELLRLQQGSCHYADHGDQSGRKKPRSPPDDGRRGENPPRSASSSPKPKPPASVRPPAQYGHDFPRGSSTRHLGVDRGSCQEQQGSEDDSEDSEQDALRLWCAAQARRLERRRAVHSGADGAGAGAGFSSPKIAARTAASRWLEEEDEAAYECNKRMLEQYARLIEEKRSPEGGDRGCGDLDGGRPDEDAGAEAAADGAARLSGCPSQAVDLSDYEDVSRGLQRIASFVGVGNEEAA